MKLSIKEQATYWGIGLIVFIIVLWALGGILLPFLTGMAIAYFLDPVADKLERRGLSRVMATVTITVCAILVFALILVLVIPLIIEQIVALVEAAPGYGAQIQELLQTYIPSIMDETSSLRQALGDFWETVKGKAGTLAQTVVASAFSVLDVLVFLVVAPVVAFYMLLDWDNMIARIDSWLPREHKETLRGLAREVDSVMAGFVRGQLSVCAILGTFYAIALMVIGLQFGIVVGLFAGLVSFIPFVGSVLGGTLAIGLALFQFWGEWFWILAVAAVFFIGQAVEGNVLTPKLVGGSVGLHPVWLMFALSAFGAMMGFTGLLIAVPLAAVLGVFFRFGIERYKDSPLYKGQSADPDA